VEYLHLRAHKVAHTCCSGVDRLQNKPWNAAPGELTHSPGRPRSANMWNDSPSIWRTGEFYNGLTAEAMCEFESLTAPFWCAQNAVVFAEKQKPCNILFLLDGNVKLTMNSIRGERLTLATATPGEILGLAATLGGSSYEMTAIALFPCRIASLPRQSFLDFLFRYPVAMGNSARLLCAEYKRGCEQLHSFGPA